MRLDVVGDDVLDRAGLVGSLESEKSACGHDPLVTADDAEGFVAGRGRQPRREPVGLADPRAVLGEAEPHGLDDVLGGGRREPERAGDRPDESGEALDEAVPRLLVAVVDTVEQVADLLVVGSAGTAASLDRAGARVHDPSPVRPSSDSVPGDVTL